MHLVSKHDQIGFLIPLGGSISCGQHLPVLIDGLADRDQGLGLGNFEINCSSQSNCCHESVDDGTNSVVSVAGREDPALLL